jgi:DNA ligase 1
MASFLQLAQLAEELGTTSSRLKKRAAIVSSLARAREGSPGTDDAGLLALYLSGTPFAEADPRKLSAGGALLTRALLAVSGASEVALTAAYRRHGDLGAAAFDLLGVGPAVSPTLTLVEVAESFASISAARTTARRSALVEALLRRAAALEAKYLLKLMLGDMRIGVKQSLIEEAIAVAASTAEVVVTAAQVRHAVMLEADLAVATQRAFDGTLDLARMKPFHPLGFMLASPVDSPEEAVARFIKPADEEREGGQPVIQAFLEDKYDGIRAQLHCGDPAEPGRVVLYSRNREDITESFPELAEAFAKIPADVVSSVGPLILDGEILAWNFADSSEQEAITAHALPFAILAQRIGRKRVSDELRGRIPVVFMAFDLLAEAGALILHVPLHARRNRLEALVERLSPYAVSTLVAAVEEPAQAQLFRSAGGMGETAGVYPRLLLAASRLVESAEDVDRAYAAARARSNEGVMLKAANSHYQPGRRGLAWLKLKRELATLDVVITGAEYGHGKRAGLLSDYTFAVRGPEYLRTGELLNVGKAYSGVTDLEIAELTEFLKAHTLEDQGHFRTVEPLIVLEVAFNNIMRSERHASGFALRFPRIVRLRPDKPIGEIDTLARIEEIYQSQVDKPVEP